MKFLPITILVLLFASLVPLPTLAQVPYCPPYDPYVPCSDMCFRDYCVGDFLSPGPCYELYQYEDYCPLKICCLVVRISRWLYFVGAGLALVVIIWGGIMYMTAGGDENRVSKAKKILLYGLIGAVIMYASGYILSTVIGFLY